jgi:hypothetical protein
LQERPDFTATEEDLYYNIRDVKQSKYNSAERGEYIEVKHL